MKKAGIDLKKAYELSPSDGYNLNSLAMFYAYSEEYIKALKLFKRAEKISTGDPFELATTYFFMAYDLYSNIGDMDKALFYINKSIEIHPYPLRREVFKATMYLYVGNFQEAVDLRKKYHQNPGDAYSFMRGKSDSVIKYFNQQEAEKKVRQGDNYHAKAANFKLGVALVEVGRKVEGMAIINHSLHRLEQKINDGTARPHTVYNYAGIYSFLGESEKAIKYLNILDESYAIGTKVYLLQLDPLFDNLRDNSEFQKIINSRLTKHKNIREEIARLEAAEEL